MPTNKLIRAILFDLGNTLIYFRGNFVDVLAEAEQALVSTLPEIIPTINQDEFKELFHDKLINYYQQRQIDYIEQTTFKIFQNTVYEMGFLDTDAGLLRVAMDEFYRVTQTYWFIEEDTILTLDRLKEKGFLLGVISNAGDDWDVQTLINQAQMRDYFDAILSSASFGIRKPDKRIFYQMMRILQVEPENVIMIGDTLNADILGAINCGIYSIWITRRADSQVNQEYHGKINADAVISTLAELPLLVEQIS